MAQARQSILFPFGGVTVFRQWAPVAFGTAGGAGISTKEDHAVAEVAGFLGRDALAQLPFYLERVLGAVRDAQTSGDADAVGVADIALLAATGTLAFFVYSDADPAPYRHLKSSLKVRQNYRYRF